MLLSVMATSRTIILPITNYQGILKQCGPWGSDKLNLRSQPACFASPETLFFPSWHSQVNFYTVTASTNFTDWANLGRKFGIWNISLGTWGVRNTVMEGRGLRIWAGFGKLTPFWKDGCSLRLSGWTGTGYKFLFSFSQRGKSRL